jgi:hypothetical protein
VNNTGFALPRTFLVMTIWFASIEVIVPWVKWVAGWDVFAWGEAGGFGFPLVLS